MREMRTAYALGLVTVVAAVLLRWLLDPLMGDALPLVTLFGAVAAAVWLGGYRVAIPVTLVGYLACHYLFIPPRGHFDLSNKANIATANTLPTVRAQAKRCCRTASPAHQTR